MPGVCSAVSTRVLGGCPVPGLWASDAGAGRSPCSSGRLVKDFSTITTIPDLIHLTPEARQVLGCLRAIGGRPLIVGGSVRDALLSLATGEAVDSKDIDIEVYGLTTLPGHVMEVGQHFGIVTATLNGQSFDISLRRQDSEIDAFGRRDFTINAMGWDDHSGEVVDPHGGRG